MCVVSGDEGVGRIGFGMDFRCRSGHERFSGDVDMVTWITLKLFLSAPLLYMKGNE